MFTDYTSYIIIDNEESEGIHRQTCFVQTSWFSSSSMKSEIYWPSLQRSSVFSEIKIRRLGTSGRKKNFFIECGSSVSVISWPLYFAIKASTSSLSLLMKARTFLLLRFNMFIFMFVLPIACWSTSADETKLWFAWMQVHGAALKNIIWVRFPEREII